MTRHATITEPQLLRALCLASGLVLAPILAHSTVSWLTRPTHPRSDRVTAASRVLPAAGQTTGTTH